MPPFAGPGTPYITPAVLKRAPTGIDWTSIPTSRSSTQEQAAEQTNICMRSTGMVDLHASQVLRATLDTEYFDGPDWKVTINPTTGVARVQCARWPILQVLSCQVSPSAGFPRSWTTIDLGQIDIEKPAIGVYGASQPSDDVSGGSAILLGPGAIDWFAGRRGWRIMLQYISGWPHTSLTAAVASGVNQIAVDDCTGWAPQPANQNLPNIDDFGAVGVIYDGLQQEIVTCTAATAQYGPGTLTFATSTLYPHGNTVLLTTLPQTVIDAAINFSAAQALERGATATTVQSTTGGGGDTGGPVSAETLRKWATESCHKFARVI